MTWRRRSIGTGTTRPASRRARRRGPRLAVTSPGQRVRPTAATTTGCPASCSSSCSVSRTPGTVGRQTTTEAAAVGRQTGQVLRSGETEVDDGQRRVVADRRVRPAAGCRVGGRAVDGDAGAQAAPPRSGDVGAQLLRGRGDEPGPKGWAVSTRCTRPPIRCRGVSRSPAQPWRHPRRRARQGRLSSRAPARRTEALASCWRRRCHPRGGPSPSVSPETSAGVLALIVLGRRTVESRSPSKAGRWEFPARGAATVADSCCDCVWHSGLQLP